MLLLCWNVAGLSTTLVRIHESNKSSHPSVSLQQYFARHHADIVCLQEHKVPRSQLTDRSFQAAHIQGYESFWSCCDDPSKRGLNGVVTYARAGTVCKATATALGATDLDLQGRCVCTDHGAFVLFNVYVPASGGQPLAYKMKFLNALRKAMQKQRLHKPVILVGDFNIAHTRRDIWWKDRVVFIDDVQRQVESLNFEQRELLPRWKRDLILHWNTIAKVMQTQEALPTKTKNTHTNEEYEKFRLSVIVDGRRVYLGRHESSPDHCRHCYDFQEWSYVDDETGEEILACEANVVRIQVLTELMLKIVGVQWDEAIERQIAETEGTVERASPTRKWLQSVIDEDGMVDAFRHFYPTAEARFTCWHQFTNRRYVNDGSRIDYTLIDKSLLGFLQQGNFESLRCCDNGTVDHLTEEAALSAATANGRFQPVSFEGGGITEATREAVDTQFGPSHTGMVYTPPSFSDHIAISLRLDESLLPNDQLLDEKESATKKTQPHKVQRSIASFFGSAAGSSSLKGSSPSKTRTTASRGVKKEHTDGSQNAKRAKVSASVNKPPANSILHHFRPKKR